MRIAVQAEDGDEVSITADFLSVEQAIVTLEIENELYGEISEIDSITLTIDKARELANALLSVTDAIESVGQQWTASSRLPETNGSHASCGGKLVAGLAAAFSSGGIHSLIARQRSELSPSLGRLSGGPIDGLQD